MAEAAAEAARRRHATMAELEEDTAAKEQCLEEEDEHVHGENVAGAEDAKVDAKTLANRKKKEKKKAKEAANHAGITITAPDGTVHADDADENSSHGTPAASPQASPSLRPKASPKIGAAASPHFNPHSRKGGPGGKDAIVRAAKERLEQAAKEEADRLELEALKKKLIEEHEALLDKEEAEEEAARQHKLELKHAKVAEAKSAGTYMTKAQKAKAAKAALAREQFRSPSPMPTSANETKPSPKARCQSSPKAKPKNDPVQNADMTLDQPIEMSIEGELQEAPVATPEIAPTHRSPIVCIMGHVDTGKTKLLDKLRSTNVQAREAGGITQQIGATFFPAATLAGLAHAVNPKFALSVPGCLVIDTPGHEAFNNLRSRGSSLCDIAILVIDIMHGLEPQTVESMELLRKQNCPFIIALNKIDVLYKWVAVPNTCSREALQRQEEATKDHFQRRISNIICELNERGHNASLYWENEDHDSCLSLVPTSAHTGEGVPDLLFAILDRAQGSLQEQLLPKEAVQCTVLEVKNTEGMGTTIDVLLVNGSLHESDQIVLAGMNGPIVTTIRALLTPQPMKEMRVKGEFVHLPSISTAMGVKISAAGLEKAVCGSEVFVVKETSCLAELQEKVQANFQSILCGFEKQAEGVYVKASTIGSLEALLSFLEKHEVPVTHVSIGEVTKKDVTQAAIMKEKKVPEYAVILAFDVKVNADAKKEAKHAGVHIFTADIIYNLFDQFHTHMESCGKRKTPVPAVFPVILEVTKPSTVHKSDASLVWCQVVGGQLRIDTPICLFDGDDHATVGHIIEILKERRPTDIAYLGDRVCIKLKQQTPQTTDKDLDGSVQLCSLLSRESNETLKESFHGELRHGDWACLDLLKKTLKVE